MRAAAHADDGAVPRLGVALSLRRRLLDNSVAASTSRVYGSGLNQYLAFCREVGIPHPFPLHKFVLELFVGHPGYAPFRGHPPHVLGRAAAFQLPVRLPDEGGGYAFSRVCAARPPPLPGRSLHPAASATDHGYHPDPSARLHSPALPGSRCCHVPRRDLLRLLWPAALRRILLSLPALL